MGSEIRIESPDGDGIKKEYTPLVERVSAIIVRDEPTHRLALEGMRELKSGEKKIRERLDPIIDSAHRAHKGLTKLRADLLGPIDSAYRVLDGRAQDYERAERAKAEARARELAEQARKAEEERQLLDAIAAEEAGDTTAANAILAERPTVPVVVVQPAVATLPGTSLRTQYRAEVTDLLSLVKYVAINREWVQLLEPAMPALNALARSQREALRIPGVRVIAEQIRSMRTE